VNFDKFNSEVKGITESAEKAANNILGGKEREFTPQKPKLQDRHRSMFAKTELRFESKVGPQKQA
jgi:hypothetical protein